MENGGFWGRKVHLIWDDHTRDVVRDVFSNVVYSQRTIADPFSETPNHDEADMWWIVRVSRTHLIISVANSTSDKKIDLSYNWVVAGFERLGGKREVIVDPTTGICRVDIYVPFDAAFMAEEYEI